MACALDGALDSDAMETTGALATGAAAVADAGADVDVDAAAAAGSCAGAVVLMRLEAESRITRSPSERKWRVQAMRLYGG